MILASIFGLMLFSAPAFAGDASNFDFYIVTYSTKSDAQMLVTDSQGRQTGRLGFGGLSFHNIPGSSYGAESIGDDETGDPGIQTVNFFLRPVSPGTYTVALFGLSNSSYSLHLGASDSAGHIAGPAPGLLSGYLTAGTTRQYVLQYDPAPGAPSSVVKVVGFDTLRQDLQTTFQLGQIGEAPFVGQLDQFLANGQKALAKKDGGNKTEAVEQLRQFIDKINKAAKGLGQENGGKRFVSSPALNALISDAMTLIVQLGGKP